jgi:4-hydroxybenzoate polyprenyltransferase
MASGIADADPVAAPDNSGRAPAASAPLAAAFEALRPYQWVKNLLLFLPLVMAHQWGNVEKIRDVLTAFVAFSLAASSAYVLNDLHDVRADRQHPLKRLRPFASGRLSARAGVFLAVVCLVAAFAVAAPLLPVKFTAMLGLYVALTLAYSFYFKQKLLVDVFVLAGLYTHRVLAGGAAVGVVVSPWLLAFCIFFFLSLAFAKRYTELRRVQGSAGTQVAGRAYQLEDLEVIGTVGPTSGYMAVLVLALYINTSTAVTLYRRPFLLWATCPLILYWLTRVWFLARRQSLTEDPLLFSLKDRISLLVAGGVALLIVLATGWPWGLPF